MNCFPADKDPVPEVGGDNDGLPEGLLHQEQAVQQETSYQSNEENQEDKDWLARIVPEFNLPDLLKPVQVQIPIFTFPKLPSYNIPLA